MTYSIKSKAFAASAVSLLLLTSCGQPALNNNADPAQVLKDARMNFVTSSTAYAEKTAYGTEKGTLEANLTNPDVKAKITGGYDASASDKNEMDLTLNLNGNVESAATGKIDAEVSLGARLVGTTLYANLMKLSGKAEQPALQTEIDNYTGMAALFTNKWIAFKLDELAGGSGADMEALKKALSMDSLALTKKMIAHLGTQEIFSIKEKLAPEDGMYVYRVVPDKAGVLALVKAILAEVDPAAQMTPEDIAGLEQVIDALSADNVTHKLYIDGDFHYRKFVSTGTMTTPELKADITSTMIGDKDLNGTWVVDVKANNPAGSENFTMSFKAECKNLAGNFELKFDAPFMQTKFDMMVKSTMNPGSPTIAAPADAVDFTTLMGGAAAPTATGAVMAPTDEDTQE